MGRLERRFWTSLARASNGAVGFLSASGLPSGVASRLLTRIAKRGPALGERVVLRTLRDFEEECLGASAGNR
ncbi:MAG: hypothetical protein ACHQ16_08065 [Candidatus Lutacidiplasmatales archaeon]